MLPGDRSDRRLLVVTESLGVGGTESHLIRTLPRLVAAGWNVVTFCLTERGERAEQVRRQALRSSASPRLGRAQGIGVALPDACRSSHQQALLAHAALASAKSLTSIFPGPI